MNHLPAVRGFDRVGASWGPVQMLGSPVPYPFTGKPRLSQDSGRRHDQPHHSAGRGSPGGGVAIPLT